MFLKVKDVEKEIHFEFKSTEYNCSVKLVGRLALKSGDNELYVDPDLHPVLMRSEVKNTLIKELAATITTHGTYKQLKETSPYFPSDSGRYLPNYLLYADSIAGQSINPWYTDFKTLIFELQNNPHHGFKVFELPLYSNNTYGHSFWPSKVWGIVPPPMVGRVITKEHFKSEGAVNNLKRVLKEGNPEAYYSKDDIKYFKSVLS